MRRSIVIFLMLLMASIYNPVGTAQQASGLAGNSTISGVWEVSMLSFGDKVYERFLFNQAGEELTGQGLSSKLTFHGKMKEGQLEFETRNREGKVFSNFKGTMKGDVLSGTSVNVGNSRQFTWTAKRAAVRPPNAPRVHDFVPEEFFRTFTSTTPPAFRVYSGDTIRTKTIDAAGIDENSMHRAGMGNPLTGPFYIEGAMPDDTLVIHFKKISLNRDWAHSGQSLISNSVTPFYLRGIKNADFSPGRWKIDKTRGVALLEKPTEGLKNLAVPLSPMVGTVGVAPHSDQAVMARDSGRHGGNLDYNQIKEGATVYLPVFVPGALLMIGDGHAAQGDGELTGDALETSLEVEFTVSVIPGKFLINPRVENDEYIMAVGIDGDLKVALQLATSELARWLESDYSLNSTEVALVLGSTMRYDVAELVGHQVSIVAKISKKTLAQLTKK